MGGTTAGGGVDVGGTTTGGGVEVVGGVGGGEVVLGATPALSSWAVADPVDVGCTGTGFGSATGLGGLESGRGETR
ncbi:MAG: hypothetical protein ACRENY_02580 [Candidatus Dormibacteria bacterium]